MKVCVLNSSGNVGKSTITRELLNPRLEGCEVVEVESQNSSNSAFKAVNTVKFFGNENFETFYEYMLNEKNTIFDIGASEIASFFENATEYAGAIDVFDIFVIPSVPDLKIMEDTVKTILFLRSQDISDQKIRVVFNRVDKSVEADFAPLLRFTFDFDKDLFIKESNFFKDLSLLRSTFLEVYNPDKKHYKNLMFAATQPEEKRRYLKSDLLNMGAEKKIIELDYLFNKVTGKNVNSLSSFSPAKSEDKPKTAPQKVEIKTTQPEDNDGMSDNDEEL